MVRDEDIARYYDANTGKFLRFGGSGEVAAIHRAIWAPDVTRRHQAFEYLNKLVADAVQPLTGRFGDSLRILDLGCGVGGTATWLHQMLGAGVLGISISASQVRQARERARRLGCGEHVKFATGSFESYRTAERFHAACAIESFVHCQHPERFLQTAREHVLPGGRLIVCDDFAHPAPPAAASAWLRQFRQGWQINQLLSREHFLALADGQGFRLLEAADLSAHVRSLPWPLLLMLSHLTRLPLPGAYWQNLAGGMALQVCLKRSYTCYHAIVLERI
ncbi:MAG: hypothetical protein RLZZ385_1916 [Pseudomonadota bacterium]|jgi:ubiquinone/menaquinone biosynthesis C-methylase UbiE